MLRNKEANRQAVLDCFRPGVVGAHPPTDAKEKFIADETGRYCSDWWHGVDVGRCIDRSSWAGVPRDSCGIGNSRDGIRVGETLVKKLAEVLQTTDTQTEVASQGGQTIEHNAGQVNRRVRKSTPCGNTKQNQFAHPFV